MADQPPIATAPAAAAPAERVVRAAERYLRRYGFGSSRPALRAFYEPGIDGPRLARRWLERHE